MRTLAYFVIVFMVCISLTGCIYDSSHLVRAQAKSITLLGVEGYIHIRDGSINIVRSMDAKSHVEKVGDFCPRPNITEKTDSSNFTFGAAKSISQPPQDTTQEPPLPILPTK